MKKSDLFIMSLGNLWRRKLRTILTLLGVVIGTASILIMVSLGVGMRQSIEAQLKEWGSLNVIGVTKHYDFQRGDRNKGSSKKKVLLNDEMIERISKLDGVTIVSPIKEMQVMLRHGKYYTYASVKAMKKELLVKQNVKLAEGEYFSEDVRNSFLFGGKMAEKFRDPRKAVSYDFDKYGFYGGGYKAKSQPVELNVDIMKDQILLNPNINYGTPGLNAVEKKKIPKPIRITVSGMIQPGNYEHDNSIFTSLETFDKIESDYKKWQKKIAQQSGQQQQQQQQHLGISSYIRDEQGSNDPRKKEYDQVQVYVEDMDKVEQVEKQIAAMGLNTFSMISMLKEAGGFADIAQMVLGGIGAVSLLVAAIGISNTMVMSIYERTKEIGVMKVIGASLKDIQGMFLTEAALIGLLGGIMGLILSTLVSMFLNFLTQGAGVFGRLESGESPPLSIIPLWLYMLGLVFTTLVGLISGYLPARRAMRLSVLKALRNE